MKRIAATLALLLLAACAATFSTRVEDFSTPIANSLGHVCWTRVVAPDAPPLRTAAYRADAAYDPGALSLTDRVEIRVFGRSEPPSADCTPRDEATDRPLSDPIELHHESVQRIEVGGASYGAVLADLVGEGVFWIGASAAHNLAFGEQTVTFRNGEIAVGF